MLQLHNSLFRNAAMQHLHNAADEGYIRFSLGHFLGFMDAVVSFVEIFFAPLHRSLNHHLKMREIGEHHTR